MYFTPDISILLSITINTVIHVIDDQEPEYTKQFITENSV